MAGRYASKTTVSASDSRADLERVLTRYGAGTFGYLRDARSAVVAFTLKGRQYRLSIPLPDRDADEFKLTPTRKWERSEKDQQYEYEQAIRQRWRALLLIVKAKLEAAELGITSVEHEFLADALLPSGETVAEWVEPQVEEVYRSGTMPALMPPAWRLALPPGNGR